MQVQGRELSSVSIPDFHGKTAGYKKCPASAFEVRALAGQS